MGNAQRTSDAVGERETEGESERESERDGEGGRENGTQFHTEKHTRTQKDAPSCSTLMHTHSPLPLDQTSTHL